MATYTTTADENGNWSVPLDGYNSGEKVVVTAEKDGGTKSIQLYAPSDSLGGGVIQFSGNMSNFPTNIGDVTLTSDIQGEIAPYSFSADSTSISTGALWNRATGLTLPEGITSLGGYAFAYWARATKLILPLTLTSIGDYCFRDIGYFAEGIDVSIPEGCSLGSRSFIGANIKNLTLPSTLTSIPTYCFSSGLNKATELICLAQIPPTYNTNALQGLSAACVIKVPLGSLPSYQSATGWSAFAAQMVEIT